MDMKLQLFTNLQNPSEASCTLLPQINSFQLIGSVKRNPEAVEVPKAVFPALVLMTGIIHKPVTHCPVVHKLWSMHS